MDAIGVIAVPSSPRFLAPERRQALFDAITVSRPSCLRVLVVANPTDEELTELTRERGHQVLQLHGSESTERCGQLRGQFGGQLWKAVRIRTPADLERARSYEPVVDALLVDAWAPDQLGGTGHSIPTDWLSNFKPSKPWWLAGGIHPGNLGSILEQVQPNGIDCSSGVESAPGEKDLSRVRMMVQGLERPSSINSPTRTPAV